MIHTLHFVLKIVCIFEGSMVNFTYPSWHRPISYYSSVLPPMCEVYRDDSLTWSSDQAVLHSRLRSEDQYIGRPYRRTRAGKDKRRTIPVAFGNRPNKWNSNSRGANIDNLTRIDRISDYSKPRKIVLGLWNARSLCNKLSALSANLLDTNTDVLAVTETWLGSKSAQCVVSELKSSLSGYEVHQKSRTGRKGGGVALIVRNHIKAKVNKPQTFSSFEYLDICLDFVHAALRMVVVYRPPATTSADFCREFSSLMESLILAPGCLVKVGDSNFHVEVPENSDARKFMDLVEKLSSGFISRPMYTAIL